MLSIHQFSFFYSLSFSVTFKSYHELGHYDNESKHYTGILNGLVSKEAHFSLIPIEMEKFSPEKETPIEYGPPAVHTDYFIASVPLNVQVNENPTVMDIFSLPLTRCHCSPSPTAIPVLGATQKVGRN